MLEKNIHYGKPRSGLSFSNPELQQTVKSDISDLTKLSEDEGKAILGNCNSAMQLKIKQ